MTKEITVDVQGQNANKTGKALENQVEKNLAKHGISALYYRDLDTELGRAIMADSPRGFLLKNVPYTNVFGANAYGEFVLYLYGIGIFRIECRAQHQAGSAQDKLVKLLFDCECMEEKDVFIVLEGNGFTEKARNWIIDNAKAIKAKNISVKSLIAFKDWADDILGTTSTTKKRMVIVPNLHKVTKGKSLRTKEYK